MVSTRSVSMARFTITYDDLVKRMVSKRNTSSFIFMTTIRPSSIGWASAVSNAPKKDKEVIEQLVSIFNRNPYSQQLRSMGHVENLEDYRVELNLDQRLDQRTYNVPLTSEVAVVWVEGSERLANLSIVFSYKGRIGLYMASAHIMHAMTHCHTWYSFQGVSLGGTIAFQKWVWLWLKLSELEQSAKGMPRMLRMVTMMMEVTWSLFNNAI